MSAAVDDDEVYSDAPSNAPVSDMRLKIAMFNKPTGTHPPATKPKLSAQPSRPTNIVGPKPPINVPPKKQLGQPKSPPTRVGPPSAATNGKPAPKVVPLSLKNSTNVGATNGKPAPTVVPLSLRNSTNVGASASNDGGLPSPVRQSIFHQADREQKKPVTKSGQPSPTLKSSGQNHTLYPPDKVETDHGTAPQLPTRTQGMTLVRVDGKTYRKLPFAAPKGQAPAKPRKPPADLTTKAEDKMADVEEVYEDASAYRNGTEDEAEEYVEEEYEEVGAFAEAFRRTQEETNYDDDELYDDINVTT